MSHLKSFQRLAPSKLPRNRFPRFQYLGWREALQDHYLEKYSFHETYENQETDCLEVNTYSKKGYLVGFVDEGYENANIVMSVIEKFKPKATLLGGLNNSDIDRFIEGDNLFSKPPHIYNSIESLLARDRMTKYFVKEMPLKDLHFKLPKLNLIYSPDKHMHNLIFSDNLSAAYSACISFTDKLLFAKPDINLILEDLVLRRSVEELREIFFDVVKQIIEDAEKFNLRWDHNVDNVFQVVYDTTKCHHAERLFDKMIVYNAALLRTSLRLFGDSALVVDHYLKDYVGITSNEPLLPEFDQIFRTYLDENEFQGKKLKSVKQMVKSLKDTIKNDKERIKIKQMLNDSDLNYNYRKKEMPLFEQIGKMDPDIILEKYVILSHLINHDIRFYLQMGINPFQKTIFRDILAKKYPDQQSLQAKFIEINEKYKPILHKIQNLFIRKIKDDNIGGRRNFLSMSEQEEIIRHRTEKGGIDFTVGFFNRLKQQKIVTGLLFMQMQKNIKKKMAQGIPQTETLLHLKNLEKGYITKNNLETLLRLIAEANSDLRLLKLPSYYKASFPQIKDKIIEELMGSLKKMLNFVSKQQYLVYKDENLMEEKLKFFILKQNIPLRNLESLFSQKKGSDDEVDTDKHFTEFMDREEKKAYTIIYGPEGVSEPEIPANLNDLTTEEMEALGFKPLETVEFETDGTGAIVNSDLSDEKREKIQNILKEVMTKQEKK